MKAIIISRNLFRPFFSRRFTSSNTTSSEGGSFQERLMNGTLSGDAVVGITAVLGVITLMNFIRHSKHSKDGDDEHH